MAGRYYVLRALENKPCPWSLSALTVITEVFFLFYDDNGTLKVLLDSIDSLVLLFSIFAILPN